MRLHVSFIFNLSPFFQRSPAHAASEIKRMACVPTKWGLTKTFANACNTEDLAATAPRSTRRTPSTNAPDKRCGAVSTLHVQAHIPGAYSASLYSHAAAQAPSCGCMLHDILDSCIRLICHSLMCASWSFQQYHHNPSLLHRRLHVLDKVSHKFRHFDFQLVPHLVQHA
jgi:hypothetical protein